MPILVKWKHMLQSIKKQYSSGTEKCRDIADGSKFCMSDRAWSVFFATMRSKGWNEASEMPNVDEEDMDLALNPSDVASVTPKIFSKRKKLPYAKLEEYHALAHALHKEYHDDACKLHFIVASEMIERGVPHYNRMICDSVVELIHNWRTYNAANVDDRVLRDDWRIVKAWLADLRGGKKFESEQFSGMDIEQQKAAIHGLGVKIRREMVHRGWHPQELVKIPSNWNASDIDVPFIENLSDIDLTRVWKWLHAKWKNDFPDNKVTEDYLNANVFIQTERWKRGLIDTDYKDADKLDEQSRMTWQEYGIPTNPLSEPSELMVDNVVNLLKNIGVVPIRGQPYAAYLVGRLVNEGKVAKDHDIDIVFRQAPDPRLVIALRQIEPKWLADRLHPVFDPSGPGIGYSVPLWGYAMNPLPKELSTRGYGPYRELASVTLFHYVVGLKPKSGFGTTEFWDPVDMWNKWGSQWISHGITIQEKVDGRRFQAHVSKDKVELITEDTQRNRANEFPEIVADLKKLRQTDIILDGEFLAFDFQGKEVSGSARRKREIGDLIPREDTAVITTGTPEEEFRKKLVYVIYDVVLAQNEPDITDKGYSHRYEVLQNIIPSDMEYIDIVRGENCANKAKFFSLVNKYRHLNGSEGVVCKATDSKYPVKYSGENRTDEWAKCKNLKAAEFIVLDVIAKKEKATGKTLATWIYVCGFEVPKEKVPEFSVDKIKEVNGHYYQIIGKAYGTNVRCSVGDIVTIMPIRIREYEDKQSKRFYTWMFPLFKEKRQGKTSPDTLQAIERIAEVGTAPIGLSDDTVIVTLEKCKYYKDPGVCPLWKRHYPDVNRYQLNLLEEEVLKYPVMCPLARHFKCRYLKSYYYDHAKIRYDAQLTVDDEEPHEMLEYEKLPKKAWIELQAKYMESPPGEHDYVMQSHVRGKSQHMDFRMAIDGYLVGWTVAGGNLDNPISPEELKTRLEQEHKGFRAEEKARQPKEWLKVSGEIKPGGVGAGVEVPGIFKILSSGKVIFGAQKPYFHEYFVKGQHFPEWERIVIRAINVSVIDPESKAKLPQKELLWRLIVPKVQTPYTIDKRAIKEGWKPRGNPTPFPVEWAKKNFTEQYAKWEEWKKGVQNELSLVSYTYSQHSFRGPRHVRNMWIRTYYLFIADEEGPVRVFRMDDFAPIDQDVAAVDEGRDPRKYLTYEGVTEPRSRFNSNKALKGEMKILSKGSVNISGEGGNLVLTFKDGLLKGTWNLTQEQGGDMWTFTKTQEAQVENASGTFVYQKHLWDSSAHYDLRYKIGDTIMEFNIQDDVKKQKSPGVLKECNDPSWMDIKETTTKKVGDTLTTVYPLDSGKIEVIEDNVDFKSFRLKGKYLDGLYAAKKEGSSWSIGRSMIARTSPTTVLPDGSAFFTAEIDTNT